MIDRFGLEAVTGRRQFYFGELRRLICAENIVTAYKDLTRAANNWAAWAGSNPELAEILKEAMELCQQPNPS